MLSLTTLTYSSEYTFTFILYLRKVEHHLIICFFDRIHYVFFIYFSTRIGIDDRNRISYNMVCSCCGNSYLANPSDASTISLNQWYDLVLCVHAEKHSVLLPTYQQLRHQCNNVYFSMYYLLSASEV